MTLYQSRKDVPKNKWRGKNFSVTNYVVWRL